MSILYISSPNFTDFTDKTVNWFTNCSKTTFLVIKNFQVARWLTSDNNQVAAWMLSKLFITFKVLYLEQKKLSLNNFDPDLRSRCSIKVCWESSRVKMVSLTR